MVGKVGAPQGMEGRLGEQQMFSWWGRVGALKMVEALGHVHVLRR